MDWLLMSALLIGTLLMLGSFYRARRRYWLLPVFALMNFMFFIAMYYIYDAVVQNINLSVYLSTASLSAIGMVIFLSVRRGDVSVFSWRSSMFSLLVLVLALFLAQIVQIALQVDRLNGARLEGYIVGLCFGLLTGSFFYYRSQDFTNDAG